jgi:hypothetical protein
MPEACPQTCAYFLENYLDISYNSYLINKKLEGKRKRVNMFVLT